jgi:hypothetical protein
VEHYTDTIYREESDAGLAEFHRSVKCGLNLPMMAEANRVPMMRTRFNPADLPPLVPITNDRASVKQPWGMLGNDQYGDCFFAAMGHSELLWTSLNGQGREIDSPTLVKDYLACNGGDNGTDPVQGMNWWKQNSLLGTITQYFRVPVSDIEGIRHTRQLFKSVILCTYLQKAWEGQKEWKGPTNGVPSTGPWSKGSWSASNDALHAVPLVDDDATGFYLCTWGDASYRITNQAILDYAIGVYVPVSKLILDGSGLTPGQKLSLEWLAYDAAVLSGGPLPPKPAPVIPPVDPTKPPDTWEGMAKVILGLGGHTVTTPSVAGQRSSWK